MTTGNIRYIIKIESDKFLSVPTSAKLLGRNRLTLYRWIRAGKMVAFDLGGRLCIPKSEVRRLIKKTCWNCVYFVPGYGIYQMQDAYCSKHPTKSAPCDDWHNDFT